MHPQGPPPSDPDDAAPTAPPGESAAQPGPGRARRRPPEQSEIRGINTIASLPPAPTASVRGAPVEADAADPADPGTRDG